MHTHTRIGFAGRGWSTTLLVLLALLVLTFGGTGAAFAQTATGAGTLTASGEGVANIVGSGTVEIDHGAGVIWVRGADSIDTNGKGRRTELADGTIRLTGVTDGATIIGTEMGVRVHGYNVNLTATGSGSVWLRGRGSYETGNGDSGLWEPDGVRVDF